MSASESYRVLLDNYVTQCWMTMHTVQEVHEAIDRFMEQMPAMQ